MVEVSKIQFYIKNSKIEVKNLREHSKANEKYIDVLFKYKNQPNWNGSIPYYYRRTGLFFNSPKDIAYLIETTYTALKVNNSKRWIVNEKRKWKTEYRKKSVTKSFFNKLLNLKWNCVLSDLPVNRNWARRIQDIKEMGYVLATHTRRYNKRLKKHTTQILLLPVERGLQTGYETISPYLRKRIITVLGRYDAYEGKVRPNHALLPDHKFPEISWDSKTRQTNLDDMSDEDIRSKFQLLDNQRNLEKREACRKVIQTGKLGTLFGIEYHLNKTGRWPAGVPKRGKRSEEGWKLCPWYDIEAWRKSLNQFIKKKKKIIALICDLAIICISYCNCCFWIIFNFFYL